MERVVFLLESTGEQISCLLNPNTLLMRRVAGIRTRQSVGGQLTGAGLTDDPLIYTGGGHTELELSLLFDVSLTGSSIQTDDVRDLTRPLWNLTENTLSADGTTQLRQVRFVWGKAWNIPGIITAVTERLEQFTMVGAPGRSWLRMRFVRVSEPIMRPTGSQSTSQATLTPEELAMLGPDALVEHVTSYETTAGSTDDQPELGERLYVVASRFYGEAPLSYADQDMQTAALWRLIACFNDIADPLRITAGSILRLPPLSALLAALRQQQ
ncbi:hypothetical protein EYB53_011305 [Candidatus Chloroploca sp. M-50]|uniref:Contractile injection system tube protein N-terminal domain-containing protein n=1 Tax=Candidatus Chloroploca mongolica TaxID=2528176 RepID=A0ABS4DA41_9CHLR|nr:hypothetical protein [Candidatus Chloroploca mongolica]MBP1466293.1 hypothetical protein [Candidatus Chloroploca mongolica]